MSAAPKAGWRWSNVPVPEPYVVGLVLGVTLHAVRPWHAFDHPRLFRLVGGAVLGAGLLLVRWAVRTVGSTDVENPDGIVTDGPYAYSRNPMYVAWLGIYTGLSLVLNAVWLFLLLPVVMGWTHLVVRQEERSLERDFGDGYRTYTRTVRRYL